MSQLVTSEWDRREGHLPTSAEVIPWETSTRTRDLEGADVLLHMDEGASREGMAEEAPTEAAAVVPEGVVEALPEEAPAPTTVKSMEDPVDNPLGAEFSWTQVMNEPSLGIPEASQWPQVLSQVDTPRLHMVMGGTGETEHSIKPQRLMFLPSSEGFVNLNSPDKFRVVPNDPGVPPLETPLVPENPLSPEHPPSACALPPSDPENPPSASANPPLDPENPPLAPNTSSEEEVKSYEDSSQESDNPAPPEQPDNPSPEEMNPDDINRAVRFINEAHDSGSTSIWVYPGLRERVQKGREGQKPAYTCMLPSNRGVCTSDFVSWDKQPSLCYEAEEHDASTIEKNLGIIVEVLKLR